MPGYIELAILTVLNSLLLDKLLTDLKSCGEYAFVKACQCMNLDCWLWNQEYQNVDRNVCSNHDDTVHQQHVDQMEHKTPLFGQHYSVDHYMNHISDILSLKVFCPGQSAVQHRTAVCHWLGFLLNVSLGFMTTNKTMLLEIKWHRRQYSGFRWLTLGSFK